MNILCKIFKHFRTWGEWKEIPKDERNTILGPPWDAKYIRRGECKLCGSVIFDWSNQQPKTMK